MKLRKQFAYYEYNHYRGSVEPFMSAPKLPAQLSGFHFYNGTENNLERFLKDIPENLHKSWTTLIEEGASFGDKPLVLLSEDEKLACYVWYTIRNSVYTREIAKTLRFNKNEVYFYALRVLPEHYGLGLSKYIMKHLLFMLHKNGKKWVHGICIKSKPIPNHLYKDLGMEIIIQYKKYRIRNYSWVRTLSLVNFSD